MFRTVLGAVRRWRTVDRTGPRPLLGRWGRWERVAEWQRTVDGANADHSFDVARSPDAGPVCPEGASARVLGNIHRGGQI